MFFFFKEGSRVSVRDLSRGNCGFGNDACVALARIISRAEAAAVCGVMNSYVKKLNLQDTHFETVHGLDAPGTT